MCIYVYICVYQLYIYIYRCVYVYVYVYIYICIYMYTCMLIYEVEVEVGRNVKDGGESAPFRRPLPPLIHFVQCFRKSSNCLVQLSLLLAIVCQLLGPRFSAYVRISSSHLSQRVRPGLRNLRFAGNSSRHCCHSESLQTVVHFASLCSPILMTWPAQCHLRRKCACAQKRTPAVFAKLPRNLR